MRSTRKVPENWSHPKDADGCYTPLFRGEKYSIDHAYWSLCAAKWNEGLIQGDELDEWVAMPAELVGTSPDDYFGVEPDKADYMPVWNDQEATHLMLYENSTEGTPLSPAFATGAELAAWLSANDVKFYANTPLKEHEWQALIDGKGITVQQNGVVLIQDNA